MCLLRDKMAHKWSPILFTNTDRVTTDENLWKYNEKISAVSESDWNLPNGFCNSLHRFNDEFLESLTLPEKIALDGKLFGRQLDRSELERWRMVSSIVQHEFNKQKTIIKQLQDKQEERMNEIQKQQSRDNNTMLSLLLIAIVLFAYCLML